MFCNKCGEILRDGTRRCPVCGAAQTADSKINTECDCETNKKVTFDPNRPKTHSTYASGGAWQGRTFRADVHPWSKAARRQRSFYLLKRFFREFGDFGGRISRGDFWWTCLVLFVVTMVMFFFAGMFGGLLFALWLLTTAIPKISMCVRRLRDVGRSGWMMLFALVPVAGPIILLGLFCMPTSPGSWAMAK